MTPLEAGASTPEIAHQPEIIPSSAGRESSVGSIVDFIDSLLVTVLLALFGTTFIVQAFKIPSESMEPTLLVGDHLLVNKFVFEGRGAWYEHLLPYRPIRHGDIVVFKFPFDDHPHYVKRVVGLPGDHVRIVSDRVYVNGAHVPEPYMVRDPAAEDPVVANFPPTDRHFMPFGLRPEWAGEIMNYVQRDELIVPAAHYFVMGDNRDRSWDSRYWGFVDQDAIIGRPILIYWSVDATSEDYGDRSVSGTLRGIEGTIAHLPSRTRWHRMLRAVH